MKERNPVAAALIGQMNIARRDYPSVRLECMKLLSGLSLDNARKRLVAHFIDTYMQLSRNEQNEYEKKLASLERPEKEAIMEFVTVWEKEGIIKGRKEGLKEGLKEGRHEEALKLVERFLNKRFGPESEPFMKDVKKLSLKKLESLSEALLDITTIRELEKWLDK